VKLVEALKLSHEGANRDGDSYPLFLACSFSPLHFETFVAAHLVQALPARRIALSHGTFGDLDHNLQLGLDQRAQNLLVAVEWSDFDPRLSIRSVGGWADPEGIVDSAQQAADRFKNTLRHFEAQIVISLPTLPLPPVFRTQSGLRGRTESRLRQLIAELARWSVSEAQISVINSQVLGESSHIAHRWDVKNDLSAGFPYTLAHADALATVCVNALLPVTRRKGIITDLDDTIWKGIVGEVGVENVTWSLEYESQIHGLYQQTLGMLAETGVLVAVASKNDPAVVAQALQRPNLLLRPEIFFPVDAHWGPKSESVARILGAWNVAASSVVFIDDSPLEIAEVRAAFPEIEGRLFPKDDAAAAVALLRWLRDEFAHESASMEDKIRRRSLEQNIMFKSESRRADTESFLQSLKAKIIVETASRASARPFELVNKTNQFTINGARYTQDQWQACSERPDDFVLTVAYQDRFGPLGTIATMAGQVSDEAVQLEDWVISCRAFSRRIEYRCLASLFNLFNRRAVSIAFRSTPRNGPVHDLLRLFFQDLPANGDATLFLTREQFERNCPRLYDHVHDAG
jgi:FkbH-like protein